MCKYCVVEPFPDRGTVCLEEGAFLPNLKHCHSCGQKEIPVRQEVVDSDNSESEDENEEQVVFRHICKNCSHVIAKHEYSFSVQDDFQEYSMNCLLCGHASDTRSVLPNDPRKEKFF